MGAEILARVEQAASRTGIDRRRFLQRAAGIAASLSVFNACAGGDSTSAPASGTGSTTRRSGGTFETPEPEEVVACEQALAGDEFIFDVHTHHVVPDGPWRENARRIAD